MESSGHKTVWMLWLQGRATAPDLVKACVSSWERMNPGWDVRLLDAQSARLYAPLVHELDLSRLTITAASLSDLIRLALLHEYGGVWADATLYCNRPLDSWLPEVAASGFFAFSRPGPTRPLASWFLAASPRNSLISKWTKLAFDYWQERALTEDYFWVHHLFDELLLTDLGARAAWGAVPRLSPAGPHQIQALGMASDASVTQSAVDWTTPVFKLTHRIGPADLRPGTLAYRVLADYLVQDPVAAAAVPPQTISNFAGLAVSTENLGDHIQIHAANTLMQRAGFAMECRVDRDNDLATALQLDDMEGPVGVLLAGWFKYNSDEWPPSPKLDTKYLGFHIRTSHAPSLLSPAAINHYRRHAPIGCRDRYTEALLLRHNVPAFLSNCISLTLPKRLPSPDEVREVFVVSKDRRILAHLPDSLSCATYVSHYTGSTCFESNYASAVEQLASYRARARLIITTMLHCALPAIAMGIPTVVFYPENDQHMHESDLQRFSTLSEMIRVFHFDELDEVDWDGYTLDVSRIKLALLDHFCVMTDNWLPETGASLGPIAPPSLLPPPNDEELRAWWTNPRRLELLTRARRADRERWGDRGSYRQSWLDRSRTAASLIPDGTAVLEVGTGLGQFRDGLGPRCTYVGCDLQPVVEGIAAVDLDSERLPSGSYEVSVCLGVLEYLHEPVAALAKLAEAAPRLILSYCCRSVSPEEALNPRREMGWVNDLSENELIRELAALGLRVYERIVLTETDDFTEILFDLRKAQGGRRRWPFRWTG